MDIRFGDQMKALENSGQLENTAVFFWSDHGRGLPRSKRWPYDSGTRVALMVRLPNALKGGTVSNDIVSLMDLGPTALQMAGLAPPKHMHGRAFLDLQGNRPTPKRTFTVTCRDRMDETYDLIRSVRDPRYRYIRNFQAAKPYAQHIDYMELMPTMAEWRRLHKEGKLNATQSLFMAPSKPNEELYDLENDPHEVNNLASDPAQKSRITQMRQTLSSWMREVGDQGELPEDVLKERMRPGGVMQTTATPVISQTAGKISISCATPGASIAYRWIINNRPDRWQLYSSPLQPAHSIEAVACRLGFKDSPPTKL
jgi:N-sulfoglucosamine sulfohydrolase